MIRFYLILTFILVGTFNVFADTDSDSNYVHHTCKKFSVYPLTEFYTSHYHLEFDDSYKNFEFLDATYKTQSNIYMGVGMSFYRFGFALSLRLPYSNIPELKKSKAFSFTGGYSYDRFYGEVKYKNYRGLRKETINFENDTTIQDIDINERIETKQNGLMLYYIASNKYNFDANFKNFNTQKKSATTFVLGGGYNYYSFEGKLDFTDDLDINNKNKSIEVYSLKVMPGIASSLVYKHFYFSVFALMGIGYNYNILDQSNVRHRGAPSMEFRSVVGYNNKNYFFSVNFNYDYDIILLRKNELGVNNYMLSFKIGMKIDSKHLGKLEPYL